MNVESTFSAGICAGGGGGGGATRSATGGNVAEANGCTFSCVPNEMNVGSGLLGGGGGGAIGVTGLIAAAGAIGAAGGNTTGCGVTG
jgi:hypothetical protein